MFIGKKNFTRRRLHYIPDNDRWYRRAKSIYLDAQGKKVRSGVLCRRFDSLVIPPAWRDVRICPDPNGHLQAVGFDEKGRKQYIYHSLWLELRSADKFHRMKDFGKALPMIRREIDRNLRRHDLSKEKVIAIALRILEETHMRIGNKEYAENNGTVGLTTLKNRHLQITGEHLRFRFKGKSGKEWDIDIEDKRLVPVLKSCQELPGQELFCACS